MARRKSRGTKGMKCISHYRGGKKAGKCKKYAKRGAKK